MKNSYKSKQKELVLKLEESFNSGNIKTTVVEMQKEYTDDKQLCLSTVAFVDQKIRKKIVSDLINPLKKIEPDFYYYSPESIHITIKNVRTVHYPPIFDENDIAKVIDKFEDIMKKFQNFEVEIEDVLSFPTSVCVMAYSDKILGDLVLALDSGLKKIGVPDDKKYLSDSIFWGNITFCRFTHKPSEKFIEKVKEVRNYKIGKMKIEKLSLITCNGACHPSSKKIIKEFNLNK